jgi:predicted TPR repeat methyltransferase
MSDGYLTRAYGARNADSTRSLYDDWSKSYEEELSQNGYATPGRCAAALAAQTDDLTAPILDFGCGTGLSGLALRLAGFEVIDGLDLSAEMLAVAAKKSLYRNLAQIDAGAPLRHTPGDFAAIAAIGVIGTGAAPISVFDTIMAGLARGGLFVFSFNDHTLEDPSNEARMQDWIDRGQARLRSREHGPHIPGVNLKSNVYVIEKT